MLRHSAGLQAAQEKLDTSEERARELYDCNKRLEDHIHDLESRKRAPLYQKRQVRCRRLSWVAKRPGAGRPSQPQPPALKFEG